ncbi:MAG: hypothetical protein A2Z91_05145 [Deltaproteobacteria bacterium GWA2_38_16]|nr:MAG: hypothetical protein A2Z91_05145 [Deltaproteobacteria bacterium GWA2_38_16]OGQ30191.1 MAG: hypothetical protein A3A72_04240 [Deltaproteobacteria bacterium RIFCSPLOWO2_01_FULL_38_9]
MKFLSTILLLVFLGALTTCGGGGGGGSGSGGSSSAGSASQTETGEDTISIQPIIEENISYDGFIDESTGVQERPSEGEEIFQIPPECNLVFQLQSDIDPAIDHLSYIDVIRESDGRALAPTVLVKGGNRELRFNFSNISLSAGEKITITFKESFMDIAGKSLAPNKKFTFVVQEAVSDTASNTNTEENMTEEPAGNTATVDLPDGDGDGKPDNEDNCPLVTNRDQANQDSDGQGNACDNNDDDDFILDNEDNCPLVANNDQNDFDTDSQGDACDDDDDSDTLRENGEDPCPFNPDNDCNNSVQAQAEVVAEETAGEESTGTTMPGPSGSLTDSMCTHSPLSFKPVIIRKNITQQSRASDGCRFNNLADAISYGVPLRLENFGGGKDVVIEIQDDEVYEPFSFSSNNRSTGKYHIYIRAQSGKHPMIKSVKNNGQVATAAVWINGVSNIILHGLTFDGSRVLDNEERHLGTGVQIGRVDRLNDNDRAQVSGISIQNCIFQKLETGVVINRVNHDDLLDDGHLLQNDFIQVKTEVNRSNQ